MTPKKPNAKMGRPKKPDAQRLSKTRLVKCLASEDVAWKAKATRAGLSINAWIRQTLNRAKK